MKKFINIFIALTSSLIIVFTIACTTYPQIEKTLTDNDYEVSTNTPTANAIYNESKSESNGLKIHTFYNAKTLTYVYVIEANSMQAILALIDDSNTIRSLASDVGATGSAEQVFNILNQNGLVKKNCFILAGGLDALSAYKIIREIK